MTAILTSRKLKAVLAAAALALGAQQAAQAQDVRLSISFGSPGYVVEAAPVYVVTEPQVIVVEQAPVYVVQRGHGHRHGHHHQHRREQLRESRYVADSLPRGIGGWDRRLYGPSGPYGSR